MEDRGTKPNLHAKVLEICKSSEFLDLFRSQDDEVFGTFKADKTARAIPLRSQAFSQRLRYLFTEETGLHVTGAVVRDVIEYLEGAALFNCNREDVNLRIAKKGGSQFIDLGDDLATIIEVFADGWQIVERAPVRFYRPYGMKPLPLPRRTTESLEDLLAPFASTRSRNDLIMIVAWIVAAFKAEGPYPILVVQSEQGTGKSSLCDLLRTIVDPNKAPSRGQPRSQDDLVIAAKNSFVVVLDNLSGLPGWLSDALSRIATGCGVGKRQNYSDTDEVLFRVQRPQIINGIDQLTTRGDLRSRTLVVDLAPISARDRQTSEEYWSAFHEAWPKIFGAILQVVAVAMRNSPTAKIGTDTRLGDLCKWMNAAEEGLGWKPGTFISAYEENQERTRAVALDDDPVYSHIAHVLSTQKEWSGSATQFLERLNSATDWSVRRCPTWPNSPEALSKRLGRLATDLRAAGIEVTRERLPNSKRDRIIRIRPVKVASESHELVPFKLE